MRNINPINGSQKILLTAVLTISFVFSGFGSFAFFQDETTVTPERKTPDHPRVLDIEIRPQSPVKKGKKNKADILAVFGDTLYVTVSNINVLTGASSNENPILLYINGNRIDGILPLFEKIDSNPLIYILERNEASNDAWNNIFRETDILKKRINVTVGLSDGKLVAQSKKSIIFVLRETWVAVITAFVVAALIGISIYFVINRELLKDESKAAVRPYSLARTQLFWWTSIIILAYVFIWFVCDDMNSIDTTALILLGISAGTTAASQIIDKREVDRNANRPQDKESDGFVNDILSDGHGVSIHRYQNVLFTLVIGWFYIVTVWENYKMPVLSETVLILMGLSSATYASMKATESKSSESATTTDTAAQPDTTAVTEDSAPAVG